jgi:hypothetical protein
MAQAPQQKNQELSAQLHLAGQDSAYGTIATWLEGKAFNTRLKLPTADSISA